jgi:hypothetical protein
MQGSSAGTNEFYVNSCGPFDYDTETPLLLAPSIGTYANSQTVGLDLFMCHPHSFYLVCYKQRQYMYRPIDVLASIIMKHGIDAALFGQ